MKTLTRRVLRSRVIAIHPMAAQRADAMQLDLGAMGGHTGSDRPNAR